MYMPVRASELFKEHGSSLIGRVIMTLPMGNWLGGPAKIIDIYPDTNASEILFRVQAVYIDPEVTSKVDSEFSVSNKELVTLLDMVGGNSILH